MHGSASGPLGALLLIVPLAAIPVFAIVGVPHFAPLIASPSDDDDLVADLGDADAPHSSAVGVKTPNRGRSADDLFAPFPDSSSSQDAVPAPWPETKPRAGLISDAGTLRKQSSLPPPDALDQWEIRRTGSEAITRPDGNSLAPEPGAATLSALEPSETLQIPTDDMGDDKVRVDEFSPDLLRLGTGGRTSSEPRATLRSLPETPSSERTIRRNHREAAVSPDLTRPTETLPPTLSEHSGWQVAARRLKELGVNKYRLESQIEKQTFVFTCAISSPDNPRIARRFEADADNPLEAVQMVLAQIDEWRSRDNRKKLAALSSEDDR